MPPTVRRSYTTLGIDPALPPPAAAPTVQFPLFLFLLAVVSLTLAYHFLFVVCPSVVAEAGDGEGLLAIFCAGIERIVITIGAQPVLALGLFVALLAPGVVNTERARQYFLSVVLASLVVGGGTLIFVDAPTRELGGAIRGFIDASAKRELPPLTVNRS